MLHLSHDFAARDFVRRWLPLLMAPRRPATGGIKHQVEVTPAAGSVSTHVGAQSCHYSPLVIAVFSLLLIDHFGYAVQCFGECSDINRVLN